VDKKLKTGLIIGGVALAGFIAYRIFKKDPDEGTPATDPVADNEAYLNKVKELQKLIGTGVDGVIGKNTKAALAKYGYTGEVNASNIDSVLNTVRAKVKAVSTDSARYAKGLEILTYLKNKGGSVKFTADTTVSIYEKDALGKFIKTGKTTTYKTGDTFKPLYMINSTPTNTYGTGFRPGFMTFKIKPFLSSEIWIAPISSFSITVV
jgi:hypothetical protein